MKFLLPAVLAVAACGTTPDERPATAEVVVFSILAPSCGQVQCHSTTTNLEGYAFDTFDAAKDSLRDLVGPTAAQSELVDVLHSDSKRMPPDSPLAEEDIVLIETWIDSGAQGL